MIIIKEVCQNEMHIVVKPIILPYRSAHLLEYKINYFLKTAYNIEWKHFNRQAPSTSPIVVCDITTGAYV